jgi:hypothetical protein
MSAEVAPQGIVQDYVTLFLGIPLLFLSLFMANNGSLRGRFLLSGALGYFLVTYLFILLWACIMACFSCITAYSLFPSFASYNGDYWYCADSNGYTP